MIGSFGMISTDGVGLGNGSARDLNRDTLAPDVNALAMGATDELVHIIVLFRPGGRIGQNRPARRGAAGTLLGAVRLLGACSACFLKRAWPRFRSSHGQAPGKVPSIIKVSEHDRFLGCPDVSKSGPCRARGGLQESLQESYKRPGALAGRPLGAQGCAARKARCPAQSFKSVI